MSDDTTKTGEANTAETNPPPSPSSQTPTAAAAHQVNAALAAELATVPETGHDEVPNIVLPPKEPSVQEGQVSDGAPKEPPAAKVEKNKPPIEPSSQAAEPDSQKAAVVSAALNAINTPALDEAQMKEKIAGILKEIKLPERRAAKEATQTPSLQKTPLTEAPFRAEVQMHSVAPPAPREKKTPPPAPKTPVKDTKVEEAQQSPVVALHTMKNDLQDIVRVEKISLVRAASMEADKRRAPEAATPRPQEAPHHGKQVGFFVVTSLALFALGGAGLFGVYYVHTAPPEPPKAPTGFLFAEQRAPLPIDTISPATLKQTLATMMNTPSVGSGSIVQIVPLARDATTGMDREVTLSEFLRSLGARPPDEFLRALSDEFFFGIHMADVPSPIFVIPVTSYDHAFAGMLAWEGKMNSELAPLFKHVSPYKPIISAPPVSVGASTATTTPVPPPEFLPPRTFEDLVMKNYDVRGLKDDGGNVILYYSFPRQNLLIISASPYTFPEILSRLQAARKL